MSDETPKVLPLHLHKVVQKRHATPLTTPRIAITLRDHHGEVIDLGVYKGAVLRDGTVAIDVETAVGVMMIRWTASQARQVEDMISRLRSEATDHLRHLRGADRWVGRPHPDRSGWILVRYNDRERAFRPSKLGEPHNRRSGQRWSHRCEACRKELPKGTIAFVEAEPKAWEYPSWKHVKLCAQCLESPPQDLPTAR